MDPIRQYKSYLKSQYQGMCDSLHNNPPTDIQEYSLRLGQIQAYKESLDKFESLMYGGFDS